MKTYSILPFALFASLSLFAQNDFGKKVETINQTTAEAHITFLASDLLKGRDAGSPENRIAAEYIVSQFKEYGIPAYGESYYHPFDALVIPREGKRALYVTEPEEIEKRRSEGVRELHLQNVIGMIEGENRDEYVVIGSHYDHLGIGLAVNGDSIYNGADDNASGVSAVLQIARAIREKGKKPKRTIIFALWDGEERGLLGSERFVRDCDIVDNIRGYLNFDMIGRNTDENNPALFRYFYTEANAVFGDWMKNQIKPYDLDLKPDFRPWDKPVGGSDNASFAKRNIPIIWYHTDAHPDYHQPGDHADKINYPKMVDIARSACLNIWNLANCEY
ncbi:MAG: M20/M25/M40 family metallo-hydrolase [Bacteroidales bacterium]